VSALVAAALVGVSAVTTWEVTRPASAVAPADRVATLSANAGQETVATIVVRGRQADVVTDGLRPNTDGGTSYYLWGVPPGRGGMPQVVGTFDVTTSGLHSYPVRLTRSLEDYPVLAVSEETAGSTPTTPSRVLARGALSR
jgi:anti-sigma-K factor RskA